MQRNKVRHVKTIALVARELGEDEDWLWDVATEMDREDGVIWVYGINDEEVMAFSDDGIDCLHGLILDHRENENLSRLRPLP